MKHEHISLDERLNDLQAYILPSKSIFCDYAYLAQYNQAYDLWKKVAYNALKGEGNLECANNLASDNFCNQTLFISLFYGDLAVGVCSLDFKNLNFNANFDSSYLRDFPKVGIAEAKKHDVIANVYFMAIAEKWRKSVIGIGVSELLTSFAYKIYQDSDATLMIFTTRNNRSTHTLNFQRGAVSLASDFTLFNTSADLVSVAKHNIKSCPYPAIEKLFEELWSNRIVSPIYGIVANEKEFSYE